MKIKKELKELKDYIRNFRVKDITTKMLDLHNQGASREEVEKLFNKELDHYDNDVKVIEKVLGNEVKNDK